MVEASKPFDVSGQTLKEIAQQLLQLKTQARSVENITDALYPLGDDETQAELFRVGQSAKLISEIATGLYRRIAKEAMQS